MEKAQVKHALCDVRLRDEVEQVYRGFGGVQTLYFNGMCRRKVRSGASCAMLRRHFANAATRAEDVALIAFTSGTTGTPKATMHYHRDVLAICDTYCDRVLQPRPDESLLWKSAAGVYVWPGGLLLFPLHAGAATLLLEKAGPGRTARGYRGVWSNDDSSPRGRLPHDGGESATVRSLNATHVRLRRRDPP